MTWEKVRRHDEVFSLSVLEERPGPQSQQQEAILCSVCMRNDNGIFVRAVCRIPDSTGTLEVLIIPID